jgi:hypothetical protein
MRILLTILLSGIVLKGFVPLELDAIRNSYRLAAADKEVCKEMIDKLENSEDAVHIAYLGAFQAIWAKHTDNPFKKLGTFRRGKNNIEKAIALDPSNAEVRFIRMSVQLNAPKFLGYSSNIEEDRKFIRANRDAIKSGVLKLMIDDLIE